MLLLLGVFVRALGWKECATPLDDRWEPAAPRSMSERMLVDYERRYTCTFRPGVLVFPRFQNHANTVAGGGCIRVQIVQTSGFGKSLFLQGCS